MLMSVYDLVVDGRKLATVPFYQMSEISSLSHLKGVRLLHRHEPLAAPPAPPALDDNQLDLFAGAC